MVKNIKPSKKVLFWDVGIKEYDLEYIEPINWPNQNTKKSLIENKEENTNKSNTTFSNWLEKKIMCGLCNFGWITTILFMLRLLKTNKKSIEKSLVRFRIRMVTRWML